MHAAGTAMAAYGELNLSVLGLFYMFTSETGEAIRLVMTQVCVELNLIFRSFMRLPCKDAGVLS